MAKQGMSRPDRDKRPRNDVPPVPEIQGKAKHGKTTINPIIAGTGSPSLKVYHERPVPAQIYPVIDTDLGRDNVENDLSAADLADLR